ncbi:helix-turn-helix domain-containing protein [Candidatus Burkholderia verschuerenii]|uniref:helix-turn-helix domain-containing protein n=1 Tax=Candidatus Burkholderia verschuerenii TaxID=242163 RepID=UPI002FC35434
MKNTSPLASDLTALGLLVRNRRHEQSMRIDNAAALLGVSTSVLSRLENGNPVGSDRLLRVLDGLGLSLLVVARADSGKLLRALGPSDEAAT